MFNKIFSKSILVITGIFILLATIIISHVVYVGGFSFWYDPARDLLSALANSSKLTLIGPPSGIPGLFYGPYWIWFLSLAQVFSKDPRLITFLVATIPYLVVFPFILSRFSSVISYSSLSIIWLIFILGFINYFTDLWNPHPAPLFILLTIYLLFLKTNTVDLRNLVITFLAGFFAGIVMNFQLSFGIGMIFGLIIFMISEVIYKSYNKKFELKRVLKNFILVLLFIFGSIVSFTPFILFEARHEFNQTKVLINAFTHYGEVVSQTGLAKIQIIQLLIDRVGNVLHIPFIVSVTLLVLGLIFIFRKASKKIKTQNTKLVIILISILFGVLCVYLTARNPVWVYHLIGAEVIILLLIGVILDKIKILKYIVGFWVLILFSYFLFNQIQSWNNNPQNIYGTLAAEKGIVDKINKDSKNQKYVVFAYSPAIYTYEYSYLFKLLYNKDVPYQPELNPTDGKLVFLIFPPETEKAKKEDFINYRTPPSMYKTEKETIQRNGAQVIIRVKF